MLEQEDGMTRARSRRRGTRTAALACSLLAAALLTIGFVSVALASGTNAQPAITGSIRLERLDVRSGGKVHGEVVFENRASTTKILMRGCKVDGLYAISARASDGYVSEPAFSAVGCLTQQELVARPGTTVYRFTFRATYESCTGSATNQPPKGSKYWIPLCARDPTGKRNVIPALPPGEYTALFFPQNVWHGPNVKGAAFVVTKK
jgi:hypothetical protein